MRNSNLVFPGASEMPEQSLCHVETVSLRMIALHLHLCAMQEYVVHQAPFDCGLSVLKYAAALDHLKTVHVNQLIHPVFMFLEVLGEFFLAPHPCNLLLVS